jgi:uncharacterized protein
MKECQVLIFMQKDESGYSENSLAPESPCIGYCSTSFGADICIGCGRTAEEVVQWIFLNDAEKKEIWKRISAEGTAIRFRKS